MPNNSQFWGKKKKKKTLSISSGSLRNSIQLLRPKGISFNIFFIISIFPLPKYFPVLSLSLKSES